MKVSRTVKPLLMMALAMVVTSAAEAHRAWMVPSSTVLSGEEPWVTVDAAVSNTLFHADHAPMRLNDLSITSPDGSAVEAVNTHTGKYRSTFDLQLKQTGTYKIAMASSGLNARWEEADGQRRMWPGRGPDAGNKTFAEAVPKNAKNLQISYNSRRLETFVTAGEPGGKALAATGKGLELVPVTHPNDLFAGEAAQFRLLIDGEPAVGAEVTVIAGAMRYRDAQQEIKLTTDSKGQLTVTWPEAGMYWLSANYSDDKAAAPATRRSGSYTATFEVLPE